MDRRQSGQRHTAQSTPKLSAWKEIHPRSSAIAGCRHLTHGQSSRMGKLANQSSFQYYRLFITHYTLWRCHLRARAGSRRRRREKADR